MFQASNDCMLKLEENCKSIFIRIASENGSVVLPSADYLALLSNEAG